ncbi:IS21 family transposase [Desulfobacula sp.]|uniref:IS21 family transposase n=1 Tax=Desulfobacula sp. TaxID=2593537 RepID=UPI0025BFB578|nr:IS21 family transposase [Desulfobacula sp.]MBC2703512.1 IS21 family transposase [Desulfobacula sp.]
MIDRRTVFEIHRLKEMLFSKRQIAQTLNLDRGTVSKYLKHPDTTYKPRQGRSSKLDPYRELIKEMMTQYPKVKAPVVLRRIHDKGFDGEITIVRDYLKHLRHNVYKEAFIRFESGPGQQIQIDWGHFGSLAYGNSSRKLYALAVIESHSRMLYVVFTHSQKQEALHQSLVEAFNYFGGTPKEIVVDNMLTAVTERVGSMVRFNESFLNFLRQFSITPVACNIRAPHEKGKVESSIKYLRYNFWPLRTFIDLDDVNHQVLAWLDTSANQRQHQTTGERPAHRFVKDALRPLIDPLPDFRETETLKVYKDFGIRFDTNVYTVPPRLVGKSITLKADARTLSVYYKEKLVASHLRNWEKRKRIDLPSHSEQVRKLRKKVFMGKQMMVFMSLGQEAVDYLEKLAYASQPLKKTVDRLLILNDDYGTSSLIYALKKALTHKLYGFAYIQNILYQERTPTIRHQPVALKDENLNKIRLLKPNLADYDAIALQRRKK